ncbi:uncharacterized protein LOC123313944 [Coccinella septempunctata]|uniref:uncharacterized protein LOC123313944 n=1 Tax=Coccinella septempunctata TaxID=41139 RepID=UPI001D085A06|nr:uncharacterized protein LOC123313944 [Coccinella septempunctata]
MASSKTKDLPQEGRAVGPESLTGKKPVCPKDSGGGKKVPGCGAVLVGDQARPPKKPTGRMHGSGDQGHVTSKVIGRNVRKTTKKSEEKDSDSMTESDIKTDEENPFGRSSKIQRTPPAREKMIVEDSEPEEKISRKTSTPKLKSAEEDDCDNFIKWLYSAEGHQSKKRKKMDTSANISIEEKDLKKVVNSLEKIKEEIGSIMEISEGRNEEVISRLSNVMQKLEDEVRFLKTESERKKMETIAIQTTPEDIDLDVSVNTLRSGIGENMELGKLEEIIKNEWPEEAYKFKIDFDSIASPNVEGDLVVMAPVRDIPEIRFLKNILGTSRRLHKPVKSGKVKADEILEHKCGGTTLINGEEIQDENKIYIAGLTKDMDDKAQIQNILDTCKKIKQMRGDNSSTPLHLAIINKLPAATKRKILECAFFECEGEIILHDKREGLREGHKNKKAFNTEAVLIEKPGYMSNAEMVSRLKGNLKEEAGLVENIEGLRETRDGHLLVEVKKGSAAGAELYQKIKENTPSGSVRRLHGSSRKKAVNLYGVDIDVKEEEIKRTISSTLGKKMEDDEVEVKALRPMRGGRQAATILINLESMMTLIKARSIKIGFSTATISERREVTRCNRCWKEGHLARDCRGPDRGALCRNCCKEGHRVQSCQNRPYCMECEREGHRTGGATCNSKGQRKGTQDGR